MDQPDQAHPGHMPFKTAEELEADIIMRVSSLIYFEQANAPEKWLTLRSLGHTDQMSSGTEFQAEIYLYTDRNEYRIFVRIVDHEEYHTYLSASVKARAPRAGEDWRRGRDLPDGSYSPDTWDRIFKAMLGIELVRIH